MKFQSFQILALVASAFAFPGSSISEAGITQRAEALSQALSDLTYVGPITPGGENVTLVGSIEVAFFFFTSFLLSSQPINNY